MAKYNKFIKYAKSPIVILTSLITLCLTFLFSFLIILGVNENTNSYNTQLQIDLIEITVPNGNKIYAEIADTAELRQKGLMHRQILNENEGMLFVFEKEQPLTFWMKNTFIPLDIIFLDKNKEVINIYKNAKPNQTKEIYSSIGKAKFVIEVNAFWTERNNIKIGDTFFW
jgi:uncharacterized membrane protein (UPF0127 family)